MLSMLSLVFPNILHFSVRESFTADQTHCRAFTRQMFSDLTMQFQTQKSQFFIFQIWRNATLSSVRCKS